ncbi:unnamed protein product [Ectocarpus fasciculatus]
MNLLWTLLLASTTVAQGVHTCLDSDSDRCLPGSTSLDVRYCYMGDEDLEDLSLCLDNIGRSNIGTINLDDNYFTYIPEDLLAGLTNLEYIRLNHFPYITTFPEGLFEGLGSLLKISMRDNALETLPEGLFSGLSLVEEIFMDHNPIVQLPAKLFSGLASMWKLRMRDLELGELDEDLFSGLTALNELYFYENNVDISIPPTIFRDNTQLQTLWVNDNGCGDLDQEIFSGLSQLQDLRLDDNKLASLPDAIFSDLGQMQEIDLRGNPELGCIPASPTGTILMDSGAVLSSSCGTSLGTSTSETSDDAEPVPSNSNEHLGCYADGTALILLLGHGIINQDNMTPAVCRAHCESFGSPFYATQNGGECWCGESENVKDYQEHGEGACVMGCFGDPTVACGGQDSFSLFEYSGDVLKTAAPETSTSMSSGKSTSSETSASTSSGATTNSETSASTTSGATTSTSGDDTGSTCSDGTPGIESKDACCVASCGQCGGSGCSTVGEPFGLTAEDCCETTILEVGKPCGVAPCTIGATTSSTSSSASSWASSSSTSSSTSPPMSSLTTSWLSTLSPVFSSSTSSSSTSSSSTSSLSTSSPTFSPSTSSLTPSPTPSPSTSSLSSSWPAASPTCPPTSLSYDFDSFSYDFGSFSYDFDSFSYDFDSFSYGFDSLSYDFGSFSNDFASFRSYFLKKYDGDDYDADFDYDFNFDFELLFGYDGSSSS